MEDRSQKLLKEIIDIHIKTARPVGSSVLAESKKFDLSPATIRNEMYELEAQGYITQPHTSAGRVPTVTGYKFYLDNLLNVKTLNSKESQELLEASQSDMRDLAKLLVAKTNLATLLVFLQAIFILQVYLIFFLNQSLKIIRWFFLWLRW